MPGKDGKDGVPGLDGEKVGAWLDACREEVEEFSFPRPQHHCSLIPYSLSLQGEAGRTGAPGEKGPNGLPVSAQARQVSCSGVSFCICPRNGSSGI